MRGTWVKKKGEKKTEKRKRGKVYVDGEEKRKEKKRKRGEYPTVA